MVYGRVYSIRSHQTTDIYIGSTKQILCKRMTDHRRDYKLYLKNNNHYITSVEILKYEDAYIELIYEGEFESTSALERKEGEYIREMECVNKQIPGRTKKEYYEDNKPQILERQCKINKKNYKENKSHILEKQKIYNEDHKEEKKEYDKIRREKNKEQIAEKAKQKITCGCGSVFRFGDKSSHAKTKKHQLFLQNKV